MQLCFMGAHNRENFAHRDMWLQTWTALLQQGQSGRGNLATDTDKQAAKRSLQIGVATESLLFQVVRCRADPR